MQNRKLLERLIISLIPNTPAAHSALGKAFDQIEECTPCALGNCLTVVRDHLAQHDENSPETVVTVMAVMLGISLTHGLLPGAANAHGRDLRQDLEEYLEQKQRALGANVVGFTEARIKGKKP
jgi:hypothetical protein